MEDFVDALRTVERPTREITGAENDSFPTAITVDGWADRRHRYRFRIAVERGGFLATTPRELRVSEEGATWSGSRSC